MKRFRLRLLIYIISFISIVAILSFTCFNTWKQIYKNKLEAQELEKQYAELVEKEENLENEVIKLQDPEYVAKYARERFLYTKEGEIVIDMSSLDDD